ncbi:MAG: FHA domain-containing protein [Phycisphaeraceae bacterium]|nr:FHA domain-containing protein [Phycisphaeraceae bacterium]
MPSKNARPAGAKRGGAEASRPAAAGAGVLAWVLRQVGSDRIVPIGVSPVTIGRHSACEVALLEDQKLSRQHCVVEPGGDGAGRAGHPRPGLAERDVRQRVADRADVPVAGGRGAGRGHGVRRRSDGGGA